ncbi:MAG: ATP-binding cassette domain-containing protein [Phycisphaerales bacterium]
MSHTSRAEVPLSSRAGPPSERLCRACAAFGVALVPARSPTDTDASTQARHDAKSLHDTLKPGAIALVTGPSGSGKSTLLRALAARVRASRQACVVARRPRLDRAIIDLWNESPAESLRTLARAGLADARLWARTPDELSEGERARLTIALAMTRALHHAKRRPTTMILDEFASTVDRATASALCHSLRRWLHEAAESGRVLRVVACTAHDDVLEWLAPTLLVVTALGKPARLEIKDKSHDHPAR